MTTKIPDEVLVNYISPGGATTDITGHVLYEPSYFELQAAAVPGQFHVEVKDLASTLSFAAGGRVELWIGGVLMFGGFVTVPQRTFFFPAGVYTRKWVLDGVDYNLLLDKRVMRNPSNYTHAIPSVASGHTDQYVVGLLDSYFEMGFSGGGTIDNTTKVRNVNTLSKGFAWPTQGSTMRAVLDALVIETTIHGNTACIFWLDAQARINWLGIQDTAAPWGFSDRPDGTSFIGWRDGSASEDGSSVINEVYVWGGSPIGSNGSVVLAHKSNSSSITAHGRWQLAENHPGEDGYKSQAEVDARANALISGSTSGTSPVTGAQGLVNPDTQYTLTWYGHDVPKSGGVRQQLVPGMVTTLNLWAFSGDGGTTPFAIDVPLRQVRISFPTLPGDNPSAAKLSYVEFQGTFGLQMADPVWWWEWLRRMRPRPQPAPVFTVDNSSPSYPYGSYFSDNALETPDGGRTVFSITPAYVAGSLQVYTGTGSSLTLSRKGTAWTETSPDAGTFTFASPPAAGTVVWCQCRTA